MLECWDPDPYTRKKPQAAMRDMGQLKYEGDLLKLILLFLHQLFLFSCFLLLILMFFILILVLFSYSHVFFMLLEHFFCFSV